MRLLVALVLIGASLAPLPSSHLRLNPDWMFAAQVPVGKDFEPPAYRGKVEAITDKAVTIKLGGFLKFTESTFHPDGTIKEERVYIQDNMQPPREFVFHEQLFPRPNGVSPVQHGHNISDLRVGDVIQIGCSRFRGIHYCNTIDIHRRPGGKVPPAVGDDKTSPERRWDARMNAEQFVEEKAVAAIQRIGLWFLR